MSMVEKQYYLHRVKQKLARMMTGALKKTALWCKHTGVNDSGTTIVVLIIIISIISITSMATLGTLKREVHKISKDYFDIVARSAAESGIELAKRDIFSGGKIGYLRSFAPKKLEFEYGSEHFPENAGRSINCQVIAYVHPNRVYIESNAKVLNKPVAKGHSHIVAERTSKKLIRVIGSPRILSVVWQVCD